MTNNSYTEWLLNEIVIFLRIAGCHEMEEFGSKSGIYLVELLVVIAIIGVLVATALARGAGRAW